MNQFSQTRALAMVTLLCVAATTHADWTRFRGPNGSGLAQSKQPVPMQWSESKNIKWKADLPGAGSSSPIVVGDRIYVTAYSGYGLQQTNPGDMNELKRHLLCINRADGKLLWNKTVDAVLPEDPFSGPGVPAHGYATHTPVSDGENVYVFFGKTGALAFDKDGKQLWQTSVGTESDPRRWGSASSPILYKNMMIVPAAAESESIVALDKATGKVVWRQEAKGLSNSWCTPIIVKVDDNRTDLVIGVGREIWGLNPENGKMRWYSEGIEHDSFYSSAVAHEGIIYAIEGGQGGSLAVRAGGTGNVTESHTVWKGKVSNSFATPIIHDGRVYAISNGIVTVINGKDGKRISRVRLSGSLGGSGGRGSRGSGGSDYGSPILLDGKIVYTRRSGETHVFAMGDEIEQLALNRVTSSDEGFSATPAVGDGELFLRSNKAIYCIAAGHDGAPASTEPIQGTKLAEAADTAPQAGQRRRGGGNTFEDRDKNGDGKISGREINPRLRSRMSKIDTDKDGMLSKAEFDKEMSERNASRRARGGGGGGANSRAGKPDRPQRRDGRLTERHRRELWLLGW